MSHLLCTDNDNHIHIHSITRRFLLTVKQTEKHLYALKVNRLYVNWQYSCSSIGNGASMRHTASGLLEPFVTQIRMSVRGGSEIAQESQTTKS